MSTKRVRNAVIAVICVVAGLALVVGVLSLSSGAESSALDDTERKDDLANIAAALDNYAGRNKGQLPTLQQLSDASWRRQHLSGVYNLTEDHLTAPGSTTAALAATPTKTQYAYMPVAKATGEACDNVAVACDSYSLSAVLSDGERYTTR